MRVLERDWMFGVYSALSRWFHANWMRVLLGLISIIAFVSIWQAYSSYLQTHSSSIADYVPPPGKVATAFFDSFVTRDPYTGLYMTEHIFSSLKRIFFGFVAAVAIALPAGLLMGSLRSAEALGKPIVEMIRPIPPLAWIPAFMFIFGIVWGPVAIVFLGIFFPILFNVMLGVKNVDPVLIDAARTLGAKRHHIFAKVVLPFTMPYFMTGVKVGLGIGWMCIVAAEMLGSVGGGVGYYIFASANSAFRYDNMYAGMIVIGLLSVLTTGIAGIFEERLYRWMGMK